MILLVAISSINAQAQISDIVLRCKVTMNKTLQGEKYKQRIEEITLDLKEYALESGNTIRISSQDSTWPIFYTTTSIQAVQSFGWKFQQTMNFLNDKPVQRFFYLNRFDGEILINDFGDDINFSVKGVCRKQEAKF